MLIAQISDIHVGAATSSARIAAAIDTINLGEPDLVFLTGDYVTQQRLTPKQWQGTVEKMRRFGSPLTDDEVKLLSAYLARYWTVDLPERRPAPVKPPPGALPSR